MSAMRAADVIPFRSAGKGRQKASTEVALDLRDEMYVHNAEALAFVDAIRPLVDRLHIVAVEIGPVAMQTVLQLAARIDSYETRHLPDGGTAA